MIQAPNLVHTYFKPYYLWKVRFPPWENKMAAIFQDGRRKKLEKWPSKQQKRKKHKKFWYKLKLQCVPSAHTNLFLFGLNISIWILPLKMVVIAQYQIDLPKAILFPLLTKPYGISFYVSINTNVFKVYLTAFVNLAHTFQYGSHL